MTSNLAIVTIFLVNAAVFHNCDYFVQLQVYFLIIVTYLFILLYLFAYVTLYRATASLFLAIVTNISQFQNSVLLFTQRQKQASIL